jgi:GT2 family glycosyltransferase
MDCYNRPMTESPLVSVVIVNWNGAHHLRVCLPSLLEQSHKLLEIIVVDNGSTDDSAAVTEEFRARWLPLAENVGLAPALNEGASIANGPFLLFVNNDMRFDIGFVAALLEPFSSDDRIFATDGMQFYWTGSKAAHMAVRLTKHPSLDYTSVELVPGLFFYQQFVSQPDTVFLASAACMLVRKSVFIDIGGFDNRLPMGYEDAEICWRAHTLGWKIIYVPKAICWHRVGSSSRSLQGARVNFRGILKGRLLLSTKLLPWRYAVVTWFSSSLGLLKDLIHLRWPFAKDRIRVLFEFACLIPQFLREKDALFRDAGVSSEEQLDRMLRLTVEKDMRSG